MKKLIALTFVALFTLVGLVANAAEVERAGMHYKGLFPPKSVTDPNADFTNGIQPAIGDNIRNHNRGTGVQPGSAADYNVPRNDWKPGAATNSTNYTILLDIRIDTLPGQIDAKQIIASTGTYIPGYAPLSVTLQKKGKDGYTLQEFSLQPGDYDVYVYRMSNNGSNGKKLIRTDQLHVDQFPGRNKIGSKEYHFAYQF
jgi:hypothetical protein